MSDEQQWPPTGGDRRWDDMPGAIQWRVLALERDRDDHEVRLRQTEAGVQKIDNLVVAVNELRNDAKAAAAAGWRNFWTVVGSVVTIIVTIVLTAHYK